MPETFINVYNKVMNKLGEIENLIKEIPNEYNDIQIITDNRKDYYIKTLKIRLQYIAKEIIEK